MKTIPGFGLDGWRI